MDVVSFNKHLTTFKNSNRVGECWSGPDTGDTYNRAGLADSCITRDLKQRCDHSDPEECAGEKETNFVYSVELQGKHSVPTKERLKVGFSLYLTITK